MSGSGRRTNINCLFCTSSENHAKKWIIKEERLKSDHIPPHPKPSFFLSLNSSQRFQTNDLSLKAPDRMLRFHFFPLIRVMLQVMDPHAGRSKKTNPAGQQGRAEVHRMHSSLIKTTVTIRLIILPITGRPDKDKSV